MNFANEFRKRVKRLDDKAKPFIVEPIVETLAEVKIVPLFTIYRRSTAGDLNRPVMWGLTFKVAKEALTALRTKVILDEAGDKAILFYEMIPEGSEEQKNPYYNPRPFVIN